MAVIFYLLGWIAILIGAGMAGYNVFQDIQIITQSTPTNSMLSEILGYISGTGVLRASTGLWMLFSGLLLLAVGGILSRLSEIAYNTRNG
jgi:hypothetical protein